MQMIEIKLASLKWRMGQSVGLLLLLLVSSVATAAEYKPIKLHADYNHDRYVTEPKEIVRHFRAYTTSFDSLEDDNEAWGIPDFVAYEMKRFPGTLGKSPKRPSPWITEPDLVKQGLAPTDATYRYSRAFRSANPNWYVRGHLAMKHHAWRLGPEADWNTHTMLNAVPQRDRFNRGIWLDLEKKTAKWADQFGAVWIIAGPIFVSGTPRAFLGEERRNEKLIAIPDALFKIVIRETDDPSRPDVLAFNYPQEHTTYSSSKLFDHSMFLTSVDEIEELTKLDFLTTLPDAAEAEIESRVVTELWN